MKKAHSFPRAAQLSKWDRKYVWHPFTQMKEWEQEDPLIIEKAKGPYLYDVYGNKYLDGTSIQTKEFVHYQHTLHLRIQKLFHQF